MNDTPPHIQKIVDELIEKKTPEERLRMASDMYDTAKKMVISSILNENPSISAQDLKAEVFLRFYGHEFSSSQKVKIITALKNA